MRRLFLLFGTLLFVCPLIQACNKVVENGPSRPKDQSKYYKAEDFIMGVDLSYVDQILDHGGQYLAGGKTVDPYEIFKEKGANMVRLRLWHNPDWVQEINGADSKLYSGFEQVKSDIEKAKAHQYEVNLDLHYSDNWADPEKQDPPKAWQNITDLKVLVDSVYNYTYTVLDQLGQEDLLPEMVQVGNEINCGMLSTNVPAGFPAMKICDQENWENAGKVINAGLQAVSDIEAKYKVSIETMLHVADPKNLDWWFGNMMTKGKVTDFDLIGLSYYPLWHNSIPFENMGQTLADLKTKYKKQVVIAEVGYPFTTETNDDYHNLFGSQEPVKNYPFTVNGQHQFMQDLTKQMREHQLRGVMYWEPAWITSEMKDQWGQGSAYENCAFFGYDGQLLPTVNYMHFNYDK
ncbi:glycoside hydrolase family 53 protein [Persicobacter psychrovividus]|uniref:Arabinogalactan endo-beta-1,4-galactanase n=1 Tax=Persicobacter psychrovividus TaxID=387638 RepID=A0ABN6LGX8_9BACT|nr:arabinogalactan endo-beta-1,4-galactanase [Persicobacter psychrovividus]